jgi:hypothetical protein
MNKTREVDQQVDGGSQVLVALEHLSASKGRNASRSSWAYRVMLSPLCNGKMSLRHLCMVVHREQWASIPLKRLVGMTMEGKAHLLHHDMFLRPFHLRPIHISSTYRDLSLCHHHILGITQLCRTTIQIWHPFV